MLSFKPLENNNLFDNRGFIQPFHAKGTKSPRTMLNRHSESRHSCLVSNIRRKLYFTTVCDVSVSSWFWYLVLVNEVSSSLKFSVSRFSSVDVEFY